MTGPEASGRTGLGFRPRFAKGDGALPARHAGLPPTIAALLVLWLDCVLKAAIVAVDGSRNAAMHTAATKDLLQREKEDRNVFIAQRSRQFREHFKASRTQPR